MSRIPKFVNLGEKCPLVKIQHVIAIWGLEPLRSKAKKEGSHGAVQSMN